MIFYVNILREYRCILQEVEITDNTVFLCLKCTFVVIVLIL